MKRKTTPNKSKDVSGCLKREDIEQAVAKMRKRWISAAESLSQFMLFFKEQMESANQAFKAILEGCDRCDGGKGCNGGKGGNERAAVLVAPLISASKYHFGGFDIDVDDLGDFNGKARVSVKFTRKDGGWSFGFTFDVPRDFDKAVEGFDGAVQSFIDEGFIPEIPLRGNVKDDKPGTKVKIVRGKDDPPVNGSGRYIKFLKECPPKEWAMKKTIVDFSKYEVNPSRIQVKYHGYDHGRIGYDFTVYAKPLKHYRKGEKRDYRSYLVNFLAKEYPCEKIAVKFDKLISDTGYRFKEKGKPE